MNAQTETKKRKKLKKAGKAKLRQRLVEAALALARTQGWRDLSMAEIAAAAGVPLAEALKVTPSKTAILSAFPSRSMRRFSMRLTMRPVTSLRGTVCLMC